MNGQVNDEELQKNLRQTFLEEAVGLFEDIEQDLLHLEGNGNKQDILAHLFRVAHSVKGSAATVSYNELSHFAHRAEDCMAALRVNPECVNRDTVSLLLDWLDSMRTWINNLRAGNQDPPDNCEAIGERLAKATEQFNHMVEDHKTPEKAELTTLSQGFGIFDQDATESQPNTSLASDKAPTNESDQEGKRPPTQELSYLKVDRERVGQVMALVEELVVLKSQVTEFADVGGGTQAETILSLFDRTVRELYDSVINMQMMSLKSTFLKLERTIRDVAVRLDKNVELEIFGADTELDRSLIEQLNDPLIHLCRNAIDHGLDTPEERRQQGKPEDGQVAISATQRSGMVVIEISDDGRGVHRDDIIKKAVATGLIDSSRDANSFTDEEVFDLMFQPGFSTAQAVSEISGRGVGLDVVKTRIEGMNGQIKVTSSPGQGTTFSLMLPITTAITDGVVISVADSRYIIPLEAIKEFVTIKADQITRLTDGRDVFELRGEFIPVIRLAEKFNLNRSKTEDLLVVVHTNAGLTGVLVDQVTDQNQVVLKGIDAAFDQIDGIAGAAILGDGRVALVIDVPSLLAV
jgi:two-component system chemotaxis sensor kinase CheA